MFNQLKKKTDPKGATPHPLSSLEQAVVLKYLRETLKDLTPDRLKERVLRGLVPAVILTAFKRNRILSEEEVLEFLTDLVTTNPNILSLKTTKQEETMLETLLNSEVIETFTRKQNIIALLHVCLANIIMLIGEQNFTNPCVLSFATYDSFLVENTCPLNKLLKLTPGQFGDTEEATHFFFLVQKILSAAPAVLMQQTRTLLENYTSFFAINQVLSLLLEKRINFDIFSKLLDLFFQTSPELLQPQYCLMHELLMSRQFIKDYGDKLLPLLKMMQTHLSNLHHEENYYTHGMQNAISSMTISSKEITPLEIFFHYTKRHLNIAAFFDVATYLLSLTPIDDALKNKVGDLIYSLLGTNAPLLEKTNENISDQLIELLKKLITINPTIFSQKFPRMFDNPHTILHAFFIDSPGSRFLEKHWTEEGALKIFNYLLTVAPKNTLGVLDGKGHNPIDVLITHFVTSYNSPPSTYVYIDNSPDLKVMQKTPMSPCLFEKFAFSMYAHNPEATLEAFRRNKVKFNNDIITAAVQENLERMDRELKALSALILASRRRARRSRGRFRCLPPELWEHEIIPKIFSTDDFLRPR
jgi:hypothetical protein